jgi:hypothetical protein
LGQGVAGVAVDPSLAAVAVQTPLALATASAAQGAGGASGGLLGMGAGGAAAAPLATPLADLPAATRADAIMAFLTAAVGYPSDQEAAGVQARAEVIDGYVTVAALKVAQDPAALEDLVAAPQGEQMKILVLKTLAEAQKLRGVVAAGPPTWADRAGELFQRAISGPGLVLSRAFGELRPVLNNFVADFLGDVLVYQTRRGVPGAPGPIVQDLIDAILAAQTPERPDEPWVILTHSMGGQVAYDLFTAFAAQDSRLANLKVAFWASVGTQVPFFEEAKLFLASDPAVGEGKPRDRQPTPDRVDAWWNVWDFDDFVSFTGKGIFTEVAAFKPGWNDGMVDEQFVNGAGLALAHVSYFKRPSFWEAFETHLGHAGL